MWPADCLLLKGHSMAHPEHTSGFRCGSNATRTRASQLLTAAASVKWLALCAAVWAGILVTGAGRLAAQSLDAAATPIPVEGGARNGFEVYSVGIFAARSETDATVDSSNGLLGTYRDLSTGISASFGWTRKTYRGTTSLFYSGTYAARPGNVSLSSDSHTFGFRRGRSLGRLTWDLSAQGLLLNSQELLFSATALSGITSSAITFGDLTGAALKGNFSSGQLPSLLTGAPVVNSVAQTLFLGNRVINSAIRSGWSYAVSPRTSYSASIAMSRLDQLSGGDTPNLQNTVAPGALPGSVGRLTSFSTVDGQAALTHTLNPRTSIGCDLNMSRSFSRNEDAYISDTSFFIDRTLKPNLLAHISLGGGFVKPIKRTANVIDRPTLTAEGSLAWKVYEQSLMVSATRTVADWAGLGANVLTSYSGGWGYARPRGTWAVQAEGGIQQINSPRYGKLNVWNTGASAMRRLGPYLTFSLQYSRIQFVSSQSIVAQSLTGPANVENRLQGVRATLFFVPKRGSLY